MVCGPLQLWMDRGNALEGTRQTKSSSYVIGEVIQGWKGEEDEYVDIDSSDDDNNSGDNKKGTTNQSSRDLIGEGRHQDDGVAESQASIGPSHGPSEHGRLFQGPISVMHVNEQVIPCESHKCVGLSHDGSSKLESGDKRESKAERNLQISTKRKMPNSDHPSTSNVVKCLRTGTSGIRGANDRARSQNCDQMEREASMVLGKRKLPSGSFSSEQGSPPTRKLPGGNKLKGFAVGEKEQEAMNHKYQVEVSPSLETTMTESSNIRSRLVWVKCAVNGELWWPAMRITEKEVPSEIFNQLSPVEGKIVSLFCVSKDLQFQVIAKRRCIRPFGHFYNTWKSQTTSLGFVAAVNEAHRLFSSSSGHCLSGSANEIADGGDNMLGEQMPEMISGRSEDISDQGREKQEVVKYCLVNGEDRSLGNADVHIENEYVCSSGQNSLPLPQELSVAANKAQVGEREEGETHSGEQMHKMISGRSEDISDQEREKQEVEKYCLAYEEDRSCGNANGHIEDEEECTSRQNALPLPQEISVAANKAQVEEREEGEVGSQDMDEVESAQASGERDVQVKSNGCTQTRRFAVADRNIMSGDEIEYTRNLDGHIESLEEYSGVQNPSSLPREISVAVNGGQLKEKAEEVKGSQDMDEVGIACALRGRDVENKSNVDTQDTEFADANTRIDNEIEHALKFNRRKANLSNDILGIASEQTMRRSEAGLNNKNDIGCPAVGVLPQIVQHTNPTHLVGSSEPNVAILPLAPDLGSEGSKDPDVELEEGELVPHWQDSFLDDQSTGSEPKHPIEKPSPGTSQLEPLVSADFPVCKQLQNRKHQGQSVVSWKDGCSSHEVAKTRAEMRTCDSDSGGVQRKGNIVEKIWAVQEVVAGASNNRLAYCSRIGEPLGEQSGLLSIDEDRTKGDSNVTKPVEEVTTFTQLQRVTQLHVMNGPKAGTRLEQLREPNRPQQIVQGYLDSHCEALSGGRAKEYFVKWNSLSHAHNTWVSEAELTRFSPKELSHFQNLLAQEEVINWNPEWARPECVLLKRKCWSLEHNHGGAESTCRDKEMKDTFEWYVKWVGLGYEDCTWECEDSGVLAAPGAIKLFSAYEKRTEAARQRTTPERVQEAERLRKRPLVNIKSQPDWIPGRLWHQNHLRALNQLREWWHGHKNSIMIDQSNQVHVLTIFSFNVSGCHAEEQLALHMENIAVTILFLVSLLEEFQVVLPNLIVVDAGLIASWESELKLWTTQVDFINYTSESTDAREFIQQAEFNFPNGPVKPQMILTTFEVLNSDMEILKTLHWEVLVVSELKSYYRPFSQIKAEFRLLLLSEPLKTNVEELSQYVAFLEPWKNLVMHGQDEGTQVAELQRRLSGRVGMRGTGLPESKKVTDAELHKTPLVSDKQRNEGKETGAPEVNGAGESHQGMDPKTLDSMPMTTTPADPGVSDNTGSTEAEAGGQEMKKMTEKREKAINDRTESFHETSPRISFPPDALKVTTKEPEKTPNISNRLSTQMAINHTQKRKEVIGREGQSNYMLEMKNLLTRLCNILQLPENVTKWAHKLLVHISQSSRLLKKEKSLYEIVALHLCLCWVAGNDLHYPLDISGTIASAEAEWKFVYSNVQLQQLIFQKVKKLCATYRRPLPSELVPLVPNNQCVSMCKAEPLILPLNPTAAVQEILPAPSTLVTFAPNSISGEKNRQMPSPKPEVNHSSDMTLRQLHSYSAGCAESLQAHRDTNHVTIVQELEKGCAQQPSPSLKPGSETTLMVRESQPDCGSQLVVEESQQESLRVLNIQPSSLQPDISSLLPTSASMGPLSQAQQVATTAGDQLAFGTSNQPPSLSCSAVLAPQATICETLQIEFPEAITSENQRPEEAQVITGAAQEDDDQLVQSAADETEKLNSQPSVQLPQARSETQHLEVEGLTGAAQQEDAQLMCSITYESEELNPQPLLPSSFTQLPQTAPSETQQLEVDGLMGAAREENSQVICPIVTGTSKLESQPFLPSSFIQLPWATTSETQQLEMEDLTATAQEEDAQIMCYRVCETETLDSQPTTQLLATMSGKVDVSKELDVQITRISKEGIPSANDTVTCADALQSRPPLVSTQPSVSCLPQSQVLPANGVQLDALQHEFIRILGKQLRVDRRLILKGQEKEGEMLSCWLDHEMALLQRVFDRACLDIRAMYSTPGPLIEAQHKQFEGQMSALHLRGANDRKTMEDRHSSDLQKLLKLYKAQARHVREVRDPNNFPGSSAGLVDKVNTLRDYYIRILASGQKGDESTNHLAAWSTLLCDQQPATSVLQAAEYQPPVCVPPSTGISPNTPPPSLQHLAQYPRTHQAQVSPWVHNNQNALPVTNMGLSGSFLPVARPTSSPSLGFPSPLVAPDARPSHILIDSLLRAREKLCKELEQLKCLYDEQELMKSVGSRGSSSLLLMIKSQQIKGEYDREADLLHKKYEALLTEEHRTFSLKQQAIQQNIAKVERNRQLAEALKLRELLVQPDLEGAPTWPVSPMYRPTTGSQVSPTTAPVQQLPRQQLSSASIRQGLVAPMLPLRARHRKQASRTIPTGPDQLRRLEDSAVMMAGAVVPSASPRGPTEQPRVMTMQTETNPESVQPANAQRPAQRPAAVMELPDLDRRDSSITAAQRATDPSFWSSAVLIELSDSGEE